MAARTRTLRPTKADPSNLYTVSALAYLQQANELLVTYGSAAVCGGTPYQSLNLLYRVNDLRLAAVDAWAKAHRKRQSLWPYIIQSQCVNGVRWRFPGEV